MHTQPTSSTSVHALAPQGSHGYSTSVRLARSESQLNHNINRASHRNFASNSLGEENNNLLIPGLEARPLVANPDFYKSGGLARSRNSVAPAVVSTTTAASTPHPSSLYPSADVSVTSQHLSLPQGHLARSDTGSSSTHLAHSRDGAGAYMTEFQRRLMHSRGSGSYDNASRQVGSSNSLHSSPTGSSSSGKRRGSAVRLTGPAASAAALARNGRQQPNGGAGASPMGKPRNAAAPKPVNYNDLMRAEQQGQQRAKNMSDDEDVAGKRNEENGVSGGGRSGASAMASSPYPPSDPRSKLLAYQQPQLKEGGTSSTQQLAVGTPVESHQGSSGHGSATGNAAGFMEGPLPSEVRAIIAAHFQESLLRASSSPSGAADIMKASEEAERQARRLLSTSRRVKVYRDELRAANDEAADLQNVVHQHALVTEVLQSELSEIDAKMAQLLRERQLCEAQLKQQTEVIARQQGKLAEAKERVAVLNSTIENVTQEARAGQTVLRQLVPGLNIENYV